MIVNYTHSRAAILCFGGWGLQTMFHLLPRLRAAQEQRAALGAVGPDLNLITSIGAVLPEPMLDGEQQAQFGLYEPHTERAIPPFHIERLSATIQADGTDAFDRRLEPLLTDAEKRAVLFQRALKPNLRSLNYSGDHFRSPATGIASLARHGSPPGNGARRATRTDIFHAALEHAGLAARLLETHLIDPIRRDNVAPDDPFVQTTLYVVAPLFEPLAGALIWPVVAQLMQRLGRQHISAVVGLFAAGSYAEDLTRAVEDAAAYTTLTELETLTGLRGNGDHESLLLDLVRSANPALRSAVGERLFDHIYLLDREKSNQGLANDSQELALLAGNALEAMVLASGDLFIQEQLGIGLHVAEQRPYSLLGGAGDYVPIDQILHAVNRQEESRLVREWVLRTATREEPAPRQPLPKSRKPTTLADFGWTEEAALTQLTRRAPLVYSDPSASAWKNLDVNTAFVLPAGTARELDTQPADSWPQAFADHIEEMRHAIDLAAGPHAVSEAWGILDRDAQTTGAVRAANVPRSVASIRNLAPNARDARWAPAVINKIHNRLVHMVAESPAGLQHARNQSERWLQEVEADLQRVAAQSTSSMRELAQMQREQAAHEWAAKYDKALTQQTSFGAMLLRMALATAAVAIFAAAHLIIVGRQWSPASDGLALLGFAGGAVAAGLGTFFYARQRVQSLRRARLRLAEQELTAYLQTQVQDGLIRAHEHLAELLSSWLQLLNEAVDELHDLSTPPPMPAIPPPGVPESHLHQPHITQALWDRCLMYLREQQEAAGQRSEDRLDELWGQDEWRSQMLTLCSRILRGANATTRLGPGMDEVRTLAQFIRQTVRQSIAPVSIQEPNRIRAHLIRALAEEFSIEHMLWRGAADAQELRRQLRAMQLVERSAEPELEGPPISGAKRRYVETAWNRAKPTANYDVSDRLAVYGITVDFAAASGSPNSDLTRMLLDEFNLTLLPTENPFSILFVRTVHGLGLDDLDSMRRYREEIEFLTPEERTLLLMETDPGAELNEDESSSISAVR